MLFSYQYDILFTKEPIYIYLDTDFYNILTLVYVKKENIIKWRR